MIERELVRLLQAEMARLADNQWRLPRHLMNLGMTEEESQKVRGVLAARQALAVATSGPPKPFVVQSFARLADQEPPLMAVTMIDDRQTEDFLGGAGGIIDADEALLLGDPGLEGTVQQASIFTATYGVICAATDSVNTCIFLYEAAKLALVRARTLLHAIPGTTHVEIAGADPSANPRYEPTNMYVRQITVAVRRLFEVAPIEREELATSINQITVRADGTGLDAAGNVWVRLATTAADE